MISVSVSDVLKGFVAKVSSTQGGTVKDALLVIDSGCTMEMVVSREFALGAGWSLGPLTEPLVVSGVAGGITCHQAVELTVELGGKALPVNAVVIPGFQFPCLVGTPLLGRLGVSLVFKEVNMYAMLGDDELPTQKVGQGASLFKATVSRGSGMLQTLHSRAVKPVKDRWRAMRTEKSPTQDSVPKAPQDKAGDRQAHEDVERCREKKPDTEDTTLVREAEQVSSAPAEVKVQKLSYEEVRARVEVPLSIAEEDRLRAVVELAQPCFDGNKRGLTDIAPVILELVEGARPTASRPYVLSAPEEIAMKEKIREFLECGRIEPSDSKWAAPAFLVKKSDGAFRFVTNYEASCNPSLILDAFPTPSSDEVLCRLAGGFVYSAWDWATAFNQVFLAESCRDFTAFVCSLGQFRSTVLCLGLRSAPSIFSRIAAAILGGVSARFEGLAWFIDDIFARSRSVHEQLCLMEAMFPVLVRHNVQLSVGKCRWLQRSVKALGRVVSQAGLSPIKERMDKLVNAEAPSKSKDLESWLGLAVFYYRHCPGASHLATTVRKALVKDTRGRALLTWSQESLAAFGELRTRMSRAECLAPPRWNLPFTLYVDASKMGLGGVLIQEGCVVEYASVALASDPAYAHLDIMQLEAAAVLWGLRVFARHVRGAEVVVLTDSDNLRHAIRLAPGHDLRFRRWVDAIRDFAPSFRRVTTEDNIADVLTRHGLVEGSSHPSVALPRELLSGDREAVCAVAVSQGHVSGEGVPVEDPQVRAVQVEKGEEASPPSTDKGEERTIKGTRQAGQLPPLSLEVQRAIQELLTSETEISLWSKDHRSEQGRDPFVTAIILMLESVRGESSPLAQFMAREEVKARMDWVTPEFELSRFRINEEGLLVLREGQGPLEVIVVAADMRSQVLYRVHGVGHRGLTAAGVDLCQRYWWPGWRKELTVFLAGCQGCVFANTRRVTRAGLVESSWESESRPAAAWSTLCADSVTLPRDGDYKGVLLCTCPFSGFVEFLPITSTQAAECVPWMLSEVVDRYGVSTCVTDGGPEFANALLREGLESRGVRWIKSAPGHASGNGTSERRVESLVAAVAAMKAERPEASWVKALPILRNEWNHSVQASTGFSPFTILTGRSRMEMQAPAEGIRTFIRRWVHSWRREQGRKAAGYANRSRYLVQFDVNDMVLLYLGDRVQKTEMRWEGPFKVSEIIRDGTYELMRVATSNQPTRRKERRVAHVSRLKRYSGKLRDLLLHRSGGDAQARTADEWDRRFPEAMVEQDQLEVENILGFSVRPSGEVVYQVRWRGQGEEGDSEEPYENVSHCEVFRRWMEAEVLSRGRQPEERENVDDQVAVVPVVKRGRGRPKGSKNKKKSSGG